MIILYLIAGFLGLCLLFALLDRFFGWSDRWNYDPQTRSYLTETPEVREKNRKAVRAWLARQRGAAGASLVPPLLGASIAHGLSSGPNDTGRKEDKEAEREACEEEWEDFEEDYEADEEKEWDAYEEEWEAYEEEREAYEEE